MKKSILAFAFGIFSIAMISAQVGIKGGVNIASISEEGEGVDRNDVENRSIAGAVVGLTFGFNVADIITIQPELLFSQSGGRNTYDVLGSVTKTDYKINYLELPILAKLQFGNADNEGFGAHLAVGPWLGYALNGKYSSTTTVDGTVILDTDRDFTFDDEDDTKRLNYGLIAAAGVSFGHLVFDLRYNYGLNNLLDEDADNTNDDKPVLQTRGIALTLGYNF